MYTNLLSHYNYADTITEILIWEPGFSQSWRKKKKKGKIIHLIDNADMIGSS